MIQFDAKIWQMVVPFAKLLISKWCILTRKIDLLFNGIAVNTNPRLTNKPTAI